eukprot:9297180-Pyramimonas_sp.AAC.1
MGIGQGTLPGDTISCIWFLGAYNKPLDVFRDSGANSLRVQMRWLRHCLADCPESRVLLNQRSREFMDILASSFSDDLARTSAVTDAAHCRLRTLTQYR